MSTRTPSGSPEPSPAAPTDARGHVGAPSSPKLDAGLARISTRPPAPDDGSGGSRSSAPPPSDGGHRSRSKIALRIPDDAVPARPGSPDPVRGAMVEAITAMRVIPIGEPSAPTSLTPRPSGMYTYVATDEDEHGPTSRPPLQERIERTTLRASIPAAPRLPAIDVDTGPARTPSTQPLPAFPTSEPPVPAAASAQEERAARPALPEERTTDPEPEQEPERTPLLPQLADVGTSTPPPGTVLATSAPGDPVIEMGPAFELPVDRVSEAPEIDPADLELSEPSIPPPARGKSMPPPPPRALAPPLRSAPVPAAATAAPAPEAAAEAAAADPTAEPARAPSAPPKPKRRAHPWWEDVFDDDFLRTMSRLSDEQIRHEVTFMEESLGVAQGGVVLDLGCGTGRHAVELASRGYNVVGYDLSLAVLARAADEAQERGQKLNFLQGDMRDMGFEDTFDGVLCWSTTFGYFDDEKNLDVARRIHRALRRGGMLLLDVVNRDYVAPRQPNLVWFEGDACVAIDETSFDPLTSRLKVKRTVMLEDGRTREVDYAVRLYALHELGRVLHTAGFRITEVTGQVATPGVFFGPDSPRIILLAEKP